MNAPVLRYKALTGGYGSIAVVRDVSGCIKAGECLCILGRNGVGKSTLIKLLSGHLSVMSGDIEFNGQSLLGMSPDRRQALGVSVGLQERPVFDGLSVQDNLTLMQSKPRLDPFEPYFDAFPVLKKRLDQLAGTLSGGERKILSFVRAMKDNAPVTLLDEPSEGVQPENVAHMASLIRSAKSEGRAFLVVEQHLYLVEQIADAFQGLDNGSVVLEGTPDTLCRSELIASISV